MTILHHFLAYSSHPAHSALKYSVKLSFYFIQIIVVFSSLINTYNLWCSSQRQMPQCSLPEHAWSWLSFRFCVVMEENVVFISVRNPLIIGSLWHPRHNRKMRKNWHLGQSQFWIPVYKLHHEPKLNKVWFNLLEYQI